MAMFLFKQPEYKRFNLKPRFWDPEKEAREERVKRARAELGMEEREGDIYVPGIKGQFRREYERRRAMRMNAGSSRTVRLFMILVLLFLGAFYLFVKNPDGLLRLFGL